jgi:hypothetical protein
LEREEVGEGESFEEVKVVVDDDDDERSQSPLIQPAVPSRSESSWEEGGG